MSKVEETMMDEISHNVDARILYNITNKNINVSVVKTAKSLNKTRIV